MKYQNIFVKGNSVVKALRKKNYILSQLHNTDEEKTTAKKLEWTKKWRDKAVSEQLDGCHYYRFSITKKVPPTLRGKVELILVETKEV